jgi:hypothetical protein
VLEIERFDLDEIAFALSDQNLDDEHRHLIDPGTGKIVLWTPEGGIDGTNPVDLDDLDLPVIRPCRRTSGTRTWRISSTSSATNEHEEYPHLLQHWYDFRDTRAARRAVDWLLDESLIGSAAADRFFAEHPDPPVP